MTAESLQMPNEESGTIISPTKNITLRIARSNPNANTESRFDEFQVPYQKWTTVLDAILEVKKHLDHSVAVISGSFCCSSLFM
jgi:succinate dehydrogenase / fumarate reductase iron-sulfur subunit